MAEPVEPRTVVQALIDGEPHELTLIGVSLELHGAPHTSVTVVHNHPPAVECPAHQPKQHRDRRPPWCDTCGRTADGSAPEGPPAPAPPPLPPVGTRVRKATQQPRTGTVVGVDALRPGYVRVEWDNIGVGAYPDSVHVSKLSVLPAAA